MPLLPCTNKDGKKGYKWGEGGGCVVRPSLEDAKKIAIKQGIVEEGPKKFSNIMKKEKGWSKEDIEIAEAELAIANRKDLNRGQGWYDRVGDTVKEYFTQTNQVQTYEDKKNNTKDESDLYPKKEQDKAQVKTQVEQQEYDQVGNPVKNSKNKTIIDNLERKNEVLVKSAKEGQPDLNKEEDNEITEPYKGKPDPITTMNNPDRPTLTETANVVHPEDDGNKDLDQFGNPKKPAKKAPFTHMKGPEQAYVEPNPNPVQANWEDDKDKDQFGNKKKPKGPQQNDMSKDRMETDYTNPVNDTSVGVRDAVQKYLASRGKKKE